MSSEQRVIPNCGEAYSIDRDAVIRLLVQRAKYAPGYIVKQHIAKNGYVRAMITIDGRQRTRMVHRLLWEAFRGPIPRGLQINHENGIKHDNRLDNIEVTTPKGNKRHAIDVLGKACAGDANPAAKLTADQVVAIRHARAGGEPVRGIVQRYPVSLATIEQIVNGTSWKSVGGPITRRA